MAFEDCKTEDPTTMVESDDEDFMAQVNVYLNSRNDDLQSPSSSKALESILKKNSPGKSVSFAFEDDDLSNPEADITKTKQELLEKISKLTSLLREVEDQAMLEQSKRKKKEKYLLKLAKELKKRNVQQELDKEKIEELEEKRQYLEHHWILAGKELDQEKKIHQKVQKEIQDDFDRALTDEKEKLSFMRKTYERQLEDTKAAHIKHCEEIGQELLKANLEADRLHNQFLGSPRETKIFAGRSGKRIVLPFMFAISVTVLVCLIGNKISLFSQDAVCSPVMPGLTLTRASAGQSFQAPWWSPGPFKMTMFEHFCGKSDESTVSLHWLPDGQEQRLLINQGPRSLQRKTGLVKAELYGDRIRVWTKKGQAEELVFSWSEL